MPRQNALNDWPLEGTRKLSMSLLGMLESNLKVLDIVYVCLFVTLTLCKESDTCGPVI